MKKIETTEKMVRFILWLPDNMVKEAKKRCIDDDITYSRYIHDLIEMGKRDPDKVLMEVGASLEKIRHDLRQATVAVEGGSHDLLSQITQRLHDIEWRIFIEYFAGDTTGSQDGNQLGDWLAKQDRASLRKLRDEFESNTSSI